MIYLSHSSKDKNIVEPVAIKLIEKYGKNSVFYDTESMNYGDDTVGMMNEGLTKCKYFFFFISASSLGSAPVEKEWHSAFNKYLKRECEFFIVRLDKSAINLLYFFKFTLEFLWKELTTNDKSCHALFGLGSAANTLNVALPVVELLPKENDFLGRFSSAWKSLASNLSLLFWGLRRNYLGSRWLREHESV